MLTNYGIEYLRKRMTDGLLATKDQLADRVNATLTTHYEFYNDCHDRADGKFCKEGSGATAREVRIELATPAEKKRTRTQALAKIRNAPVPTKAQVKKARLDLKNASRAGGEARGGSAADRRRQRFNLFKEFGGVTRGYVVDHQSGIKLHYTDDPTLNPRGYPLLERGKIFVKKQGGGYTLSNLIPESFDTNRSRNDRAVRKENLN